MGEEFRPEELSRIMADPRYSEIPMPCMHYKNLVNIGNQFDAGGWTCKAFPEQIPNDIMALQNPHTEKVPSQIGDSLYDPKIYKEDHSGREWHYTADATWKFVDTGTKE